MSFYIEAFGAKEITRQETPNGKLVHGRLRIGDSIVMLSDVFPGASTQSPSSAGTTTVTIHLYCPNVDAMWARACAAGATVIMPLENQFWGERYGQLRDPFGHHWSLSQRVRMSPKEMEAKRREAMAGFGQAEPAGRDGPA
jgi:PhnB protein